jgi:hypothetical protein
LESGASEHITGRRDLFIEFGKRSGVVTIGDGAPLQVEGVGTVLLHLSEDAGAKDIKLSEVHYVPRLKDNLISVGKLASKGLTIDMSSCEATL